VQADSIVMDNAEGTAREAVVFATARQRMELPAWAELPFIDGAEHGIIGNLGDDQTQALQDAIDATPEVGGTITWLGTCTVLSTGESPICGRFGRLDIRRDIHREQRRIWTAHQCPP